MSGEIPAGTGSATGVTGPDAIRVRVRLFARLRELVGARSVDVDLPGGAVVEDAWSALVAAHPAAAPMRPHVRFAVDGAYTPASAPLADGAELACIPPVSGGSGGGAPREERILEIREEPFSAAIVEELAARLATDDDGAVVGFIGRTRVTPGAPAPGEEAEAARYAGIPVEALDYEALEPMALRVLAGIADEVEARFGVRRIAIVHRTGRVPLGEPAVAIVAVSPHRAEAFDAAEYAMDETKARAPIWKAEVHAGGHVWIGAAARSGPDEAAVGPGGRGPDDVTAGPGAERPGPTEGRT